MLVEGMAQGGAEDEGVGVVVEEDGDPEGGGMWHPGARCGTGGSAPALGGGFKINQRSETRGKPPSRVPSWPDPSSPFPVTNLQKNLWRVCAMANGSQLDAPETATG